MYHFPKRELRFVYINIYLFNFKRKRQILHYAAKY